jgi:hypothetical protein
MSNSTFELFPIFPSEENAKAIIDLRYGDLIHAGLSASKAEKLANSDSRSHIDKQIEELEVATKAICWGC